MLSLALPLFLCLTSPSEGLEPKAELTNTSAFVGEGVELDVTVVADDERPRIVPPKPTGGSVVLLGEDFRRLSASGIGDVVSSKNLFIWRYRVVPSRVGKLEITPFRVELTGKSGVTSRAVLTAKPLPPARPAGFLGGVGRLKLTTEVEPASVRLGTDFEYRIRLEGPGAVGSVEWPDLSRLESLPIKPKIGKLANTLKDEPPSRLLRYRIRPEKAGKVRLPVLTVAWLDPKSQRWFTAASNATEINVEDVPRFDPAAPPPAETSPERASSRLAPLLGSGVTGGAVVVLLAVGARRRRGFRQAVRTLEQAIAAAESDEAALVVARSILELLSLLGRVEEGELTPAEVESEATRLGVPGQLAERLVRLASDCDACRYVPSAEMPGELKSRAIACFRSLANTKRKRLPARR